MAKGTKGDAYAKEVIRKILDEGCWDKYPSSVYPDGTPAYTISFNHGLMSYDLTKGETPLITLRPIAVKKAIGELLWMYQDESNDINLLEEKYGVMWWRTWDIGDGTIGAAYGETIRRHNLLRDLLEDIEKNPDGRRHILNLWQVDDFKSPHGLKPCTYESVWNVRHGKDGIDYLDMCLIQRSSDFVTAGTIDQIQYLIFLHLVARHTGYTPGKFSWFYDNIHLYDRHIDIAKEMLEREPIDCNVEIWLNPEKKNFYDFTVDDVKIVGYPVDEIKAKNPQFKFEVGEEHIDVTGFDLDAFISKNEVSEDK